MLHSKEIDATKILPQKNALNGNNLNLSFYLSIKRVETFLVSNCCQDVDILACVITQILTKQTIYSYENSSYRQRKKHKTLLTINTSNHDLALV